MNNSNNHLHKGIKSKLSNGVKFSFTITYILLLTTATITFIEAIRTNDPIVRHVLNLETCISVVAGYFYSVFVAKLDEAEKSGMKVNWIDITQTRYVDWCITTPMMLFTLCLVLARNSKQEIHIPNLLAIVGLNYFMIFGGYCGEIGWSPRWMADLAGFAAFFGMFYLIYRFYVSPRPSNRDNQILYWFYLIVWSLYGVVYMMDEEVKNIIMNMLDLTSKCLIGLGLWMYYTKTVKL